MIKGNKFISLGRFGMDLYPEESAKIAHATLMRPALGGSSGNIAAGIARLGGKVEALSLISDDPVGRFVQEECKAYNIGTRFLYKAPKGTNTSLALVENRLENFEVIIYRNNASDIALTLEMVHQVDFDEFDALVVTGTALSAEPSRSATLEAMQRAPVSIIDLDYRIAAWVDEHPAELYKKSMALADIIIGNDEEFALVGGLETARQYGQDKIVVYKMGEKGAITFHHGKSFETPIFPVKALKPVGAGDAFMAGFLMALAAQKPLPRAVEEGAANAAIVVTRPACSSAMPTCEELDQFLEQRHSSFSY